MITVYCQEAAEKAVSGEDGNSTQIGNEEMLHYLLVKILKGCLCKNALKIFNPDPFPPLQVKK